jgi:hypothetical protein
MACGEMINKTPPAIVCRMNINTTCKISRHKARMRLSPEFQNGLGIDFLIVSGTHII